MNILKNSRGFTLIEVLLVVALISILAGIVILAINPTKQLGEGNNAQRRADVNTIINAIYQYAIDNNGSMPSGIDSVTGTSQILGTDGSGCDSTCTAASSTAACVDLSGTLAPTYIVSIPQDPVNGVVGNTEYYVNKDTNGRITVGACDPDQSATINVTR